MEVNVKQLFKQVVFVQLFSMNFLNVFSVE